MRDIEKTKEELMNELAELRHRITELEACEVERKRAEEEMHKVTRQLESVIDNANVLFDAIDREGNILLWNRATEVITGYSREEVVGHNKVWKWLYPDREYRRAIAAKAGAVVEGQIVEDMETTIRTKRGEDRTLSWYARNLVDEEGNSVGAFWLGTDITERKKAQERLKASEDQYRALVDNANEAIVVAQDGMLKFVNPKGTELTGYSREELTTKPFTEFIHPDDRDMVIERHLGRLKGEQFPFVYPFRIVDKEGDIKWMEINAVLIEWEGRPATLDFLSDITERKRAEERIEASLKEKEVLLREIHHRVKNNLQVMSSLLKLQSAQIRDERCAEMLDESQNRVKTMALIHEKLYQSEDLARIDLGGYIKSLAHGLFRAYGAEAGRLTLRTEVEDIRLGVNYATPCGLIINELVCNSLQHAFPKRKEGEIKIAMRRIGENEVELVVSDNGIGIPESLEVGNPESLGLRLVTMLAKDQLGGQVELDRTEGTRFQIRFGVAE